MLKTYPRDKHRGSCWLDLIEDRPVHEDQGFRFQPSVNHFRKAHDITHNIWAWYVAKWRYQGEEIFSEPPCAPPANLVIPDEYRSYPYVWATWEEHDGTPSCGFILEGYC